MNTINPISRRQMLGALTAAPFFSGARTLAQTGITSNSPTIISSGVEHSLKRLTIPLMSHRADSGREPRFASNAEVFACFYLDVNPYQVEERFGSHNFNVKRFNPPGITPDAVVGEIVLPAKSYVLSSRQRKSIHPDIQGHLNGLGIVPVTSRNGRTYTHKLQGLHGLPMFTEAGASARYKNVQLSFGNPTKILTYKSTTGTIEVNGVKIPKLPGSPIWAEVRGFLPPVFNYVGEDFFPYKDESGNYAVYQDVEGNDYYAFFKAAVNQRDRKKLIPWYYDVAPGRVIINGRQAISDLDQVRVNGRKGYYTPSGRNNTLIEPNLIGSDVLEIEGAKEGSIEAVLVPVPMVNYIAKRISEKVPRISTFAESPALTFRHARISQGSARFGWNMYQGATITKRGTVVQRGGNLPGGSYQASGLVFQNNSVVLDSLRPGGRVTFENKDVSIRNRSTDPDGSGFTVSITSSGGYQVDLTP